MFSENSSQALLFIDDIFSTKLVCLSIQSDKPWDIWPQLMFGTNHAVFKWLNTNNNNYNNNCTLAVATQRLHEEYTFSKKFESKCGLSLLKDIYLESFLL